MMKILCVASHATHCLTWIARQHKKKLNKIERNNQNYNLNIGIISSSTLKRNIDLNVSAKVERK